MSLQKYRQKRNFKESPEPAGSEDLRAKRAATGTRQPFFCVQKHLASHLHYDFRLEHEGVLLSWAVPKGPSLDPKTKRLAMQVEDHPIEYGTFEGVIPSGYGAGIVMLWDQGTWTPQVDDVDAALRKGDLKFTLDGYKLKGSWALVRTSGRGGGTEYGSKPSWLLIKHRDDWSGELDIAEFAPRSVKSDGDFEDILAADQPDVWVSHRPAKGGDAGKMLQQIIERAAALKAAKPTAPAPTAPKPAAGDTLRDSPKTLTETAATKTLTKTAKATKAPKTAVKPTKAKGARAGAVSRKAAPKKPRTKS
jgi:bifunctional non-homologous end joining protein LigD